MSERSDNVTCVFMGIAALGCAVLSGIGFNTAFEEDAKARQLNVSAASHQSAARVYRSRHEAAGRQEDMEKYGEYGDKSLSESYAADTSLALETDSIENGFNSLKLGVQMGSVAVLTGSSIVRIRQQY